MFESRKMMREGKSNLKVDLAKQEQTNKRIVNESSEGSTIHSRYYKQQYRRAWEQLPEFNGWLEEVPDNSSRAFCKVCNRNLHAHRLTLLKHTASIKHMKLAQEQYKVKKLEEDEAREKSNQKAVSVEVDGNPDEEIICNNDNGSENCTTISSIKTGSNLSTPAHGSNSTYADKSSNPEPEPVAQSPLTTHVLDTAKGLPVPGLPISVYQLIEGRWTYINEAHTNPDGRCTNLLTKDNLKPGRFKLHFDTDKYFELRNSDRLFPFIEIVFDVRSPVDHLHIPLLMSPYGYTTYRGS